PIYCTANAIDSINGHHHHPEWNFKVVKTGDTLDIGNGKQLIFAVSRSQFAGEFLSASDSKTDNLAKSLSASCRFFAASVALLG
ncbi:hypothetical protein MJI47_30690, partial [Salmonella enterica subsp. enterica serovar Kentucky]|nr:hypothetical protein [Salmonella enterica subsp. enterica serovar Kentucky]